MNFCIFLFISSFPQDPLLPIQFGINNSIPYFEGEDTQTVFAWRDGFSGSNIIFGFIGNGCYNYHEDLEDKHIQELDYSFDDNSSDVSPSKNDPDYEHQTGIIGITLSSSNSICIAGMAYNSKYFCFKNTNTNPLILAKAIRFHNNNSNIKVFTTINKCSQVFNTHFEICPPPIPDTHIDNAFNDVAGSSIFVASSGIQGLSGINSNTFLETSHFSVITVSDSTPFGGRAFWSNKGPSIVVNAPSGGNMIPFGDKFHPYPATIGMESMKCSVDQFRPYGVGVSYVSGTIAFMLESNKGLSNRDIMHIMALTSQRNDPGHPSWIKNSEGYFYSDIYGFGRIDSLKASQLARIWNKLPQRVTTNIHFAGFCVKSRSGFSIIPTNYVYSHIQFIEFLIIKLQAHSISHLILDVISPMGTRARIIGPSFVHDSKVSTRYIVRTFYGEKANGIWSIFVANEGFGEINQIDSIDFEIHGLLEIPPFMHQNQTIGKNPRIVFNSSKIQIELPIRNIQCMKDFKIKVMGAIDPIDVYLYDDLSRGFYPLRENITNMQTEIMLSLPCFLKNRTVALYIQSLKMNEGSIKYFEFSNPYSKEMIIDPKPYDVIRWKFGYTNTMSIALSFTNQEIFPDSDFFIVHIGIYDIKKKEKIYERPYFLRELSSISFPISQSIPNALLYVIPRWNSNISGCNTLIQPISILKDLEEIPSKFYLNISSNCPIPPGIFYNIDQVDDIPTTNDVQKRKVLIASFVVLILVLVTIIIIWDTQYRDKKLI